MSTLTEDEREQVEQARAEAESRTKEAIAVERAQRRIILDEANAVEAWLECWVHLDLREFDSKEEVPWPPHPVIRLEPRSVELDNHVDVEGTKAERNWTRPDDLWMAHHRIEPRYPSHHIAIEAFPDIPPQINWYGLLVRVALFGEVERFTRPGQSSRSVVRHGLGYTRTESTPDQDMWRGTQARVTGVAGQRDSDTDTVYLHYSHWWFDDGRKYPTTERTMNRDFLASDIAALWDIPVVN